MTGRTISHYKILEKLGQGGMGVVYKAEDTKLKRIVALKFLPEHLTSTGDERARFLQEAQAAATLNHPNVCTIYRIDEAEGKQFIEMEYVDGETLRRKIPVQKTEDAVRIALQIGEALHEAHARGIVHRDIKAENIMINGRNQVKVMDFGLAKLKGSLKLTRTSSTVGTLAYMAPEQIQGGEVDARSDIFSFGIVLFELLTAKTPFRGEHEAAMMYSIMNEEPGSAIALRPDISPDLDRIIRRALEKDPEDRYQHVDDMVSELRRLQKTRSTDRVDRSAVHAAPPAAPGAAGTASHRSADAAGESSGSAAVRKRTRVPLIAASIVVVSALGAAAWFMLSGKGTTGRIDSIAVLPFANAGSDANMEYVSDGITENIINGLTRLKRLRVVPRSTVFHYKGRDVDPQKAGDELKVNAVLTGRVVQRGDDLTIQTELIDIRSQSQLWGNQYAGKQAGILGLQDEIARDVAAQLQLQLSGDEQKTLTKRGTENPEAYQLYLKGRYYWNKRTSDDIQKGIENFQSAIALDPGYALAYAGLADCYIVLPQYSGLPGRELLLKGRAAAEKALALDNSLAEPHTALGLVYEEAEYDWASAEREYRRAIELNPSYPTAHQWYAILLSDLGRNDEAIAEAEKAYQLDPLALIINNIHACGYYWAGRYDEALAAQRRTVELDSTFNTGRMFMGMILLEQGKLPQATAELEAAVRYSKRRLEALAQLGRCYALSGRSRDALALRDELKGLQAKGLDASYSIAVVEASLGNDDTALSYLEEAYRNHSWFIIQMRATAAFNHLRGNPRYAALLRSVGVEK